MSTTNHEKPEPTICFYLMFLKDCKNVFFLKVLFLIIISSHDLKAHEFYMSYTSVKYNPENEELFIRIKLFVNDLEESLYEYQGLSSDFQKNSPIENKEHYIEKYIHSKLSISINEKPVEKLITFSIETSTDRSLKITRKMPPKTIQNVTKKHTEKSMENDRKKSPPETCKCMEREARFLLDTAKTPVTNEYD